MVVEEKVIQCLLDGDLSIRWQVLRDIVKANSDDITRERQKIAREGWGAQLLSHQDPDGRWAGQLYDHNMKNSSVGISTG